MLENETFAFCGQFSRMEGVGQDAVSGDRCQVLIEKEDVLVSFGYYKTYWRQST